MDNKSTYNDLQNLEEALEVKFTQQFKDMFVKYSGGMPEPNCFTINGKEKVFGGLLTFDSESNDSIIKTYMRNGTRILSGLVPFAFEPSGDYICLNYVYTVKENEPSITYFYHEQACDKNQLIKENKHISTNEMVDKMTNCLYPIADTLEDFLDSLHDGNSEKSNISVSNEIISSKSVRNKNIEIMLKKGIEIPEHLPLLPELNTLNFKNSLEIAKRAVRTLITAVYSELLLNKEDPMNIKAARECVNNITSYFKIHDLNEVLTPKELNYIITGGNVQEQTNHLWNYEALYCLEWILGLCPWTSVDNICDVEFAASALQRFNSVKGISEKADFISKEEIFEKADFIYLMHWAANEAYVDKNQKDKNDLDVIMERHKTLNWVINVQNSDWDNIKIDA